jgi:PhzF family phenazine biosynthesis protein
LRYFAPRREMEMCVHATVAAVTVLAGDACARAGTIAVQTPLGALNVEYGGGAVTVPQLRPVFAARNPSRETTAVAMGIMAGQIAERPIVSVSCSRPKLIIPPGSPKTLRALRPDTAQIEHLCQTYETTGFRAGMSFVPVRNVYSLCYYNA